MAASFKGWGESWGATWDRIRDPNAMYGSTSLRITAAGTLTGVNLFPEADPLWLPMFGSNLRKQKRAQTLRRRKDEEEMLLFFQN